LPFKVVGFLIAHYANRELIAILKRPNPLAKI
jgi:hypothetical protein